MGGYINNEKLAELLKLFGYPLMAAHARNEKNLEMLQRYATFLTKNMNRLGYSVIFDKKSKKEKSHD